MSHITAKHLLELTGGPIERGYYGGATTTPNMVFAAFLADGRFIEVDDKNIIYIDRKPMDDCYIVWN
jgi:hypothetical protein